MLSISCPYKEMCLDYEKGIKCNGFYNFCSFYKIMSLAEHDERDRHKCLEHAIEMEALMEKKRYK